MKKLISLILCLLLCFTFIVSCENEEAPSSSSSSSSSEEESVNLITNEAEVNYYYTIKFPLASGKSSSVYMVENNDELSAKLSELEATPDRNYTFPIKEALYQTCYVFVISNSEPQKYWQQTFLGFRDITKTENGYTLISDYLNRCIDVSVDDNGNPGYSLEEPEPGIGTSGEAYGYIVVIPRTEFETPPSEFDIEIARVEYNMGFA